MYKRLLRPILFSLDPEKAHRFTLKILGFIHRFPGAPSIFRKRYVLGRKELKKQILGFELPNPVGLAAGFDKDAKAFEQLSDLGFGSIEIGTVTPRPQPGNPRPRLFRVPEDEALINRMGFNNDGVDRVVERLKGRKKKNLIIGGNIGKNKTTPNEQAFEDYAECFRKLHPYVDYFVVNVSSPNTPGLRELQGKEPLKKLLNGLKEVGEEFQKKKPILLKISPDLTKDQLDDILAIISSTDIEGVIATNTTVERSGLKTPRDEIKRIGNGGVSGQPLSSRSTEVIQYLKERSNGRSIIVGVGGIDSPEKAIEKLNAGADWIQLYTGFIYEGPSLVKRINKGILENQKTSENRKVHEDHRMPT